MRKQQMPKRPKASPKVLGRTLKMLFSFYPVLMPVTILCILISAVSAALPPVFMQQVIAEIEIAVSGNIGWEEAAKAIVPKVLLLAGFYVISLAALVVQMQLMAIITQGFLCKLRRAAFDKMQALPIRYFDTHKHGDIMSHYTNDIDTLRELVSQALPALLQCVVVLVSVFFVMLYFSIWMTLVLLCGVIVMVLVSKKIAGGSAKYFIRQQRALGKTEGFIQEMMNGQKVIKVFNHERQSEIDFDEVNEALFRDASKAHAFANTLGPIIGNIGNILYVIMAVTGGVFLLSSVPNVALGAFPVFTISIVVPFLNMAKQFTGNVNQASQQINMVVMGMAGGARLFEMMDEQPEPDDGYVTLVNAKYDENGQLVETSERTRLWAWKHPHQADGSVTYTLLQGDVRLTEVDFAYEEGKPVLHDVSVYAEPGQKVAFVGATGAGKTTITNLINRFYDIADGKIRYGRLDATDEECIEAAKLAGADDFITRLPQGYDTDLSNNGANLSQGQRQLLAIARAAVADPPVMILDEATSSIDTRTEAIVQRGMDKLMEGRTVFVIAHRLSTVMNSDVIMVLDHGRIIERGNHEKLIAERGTYYRLYTGAFELE